MPLSNGQGSGDFRETSGRVQIFHEGIRNSVCTLSADAFTQSNPAVVTTAGSISTTLSGITKKGVLGGSVAFTRYDAGNGYIGGAAKISAAYDALVRPLGVFINDAIGNPYENTPGVSSSRGPYLCGRGTIGVSIWETNQQVGGTTGLVYHVGDRLYASVNGLLTNLVGDAYEYNVTSQNDYDYVTIMGIVKIAPDANNSLLVLDLRV